MIRYKGHKYVEAGAKLPLSYTEDDTKAVDKVVDEFVSGIISALQPQGKPAKDLGKALSYVLEQVESKLKEDPAISTVDSGSLPKGLRK
jgi:nucleoid DNA-binding protein